MGNRKQCRLYLLEAKFCPLLSLCSRESHSANLWASMGVVIFLSDYHMALYRLDFVELHKGYDLFSLFHCISRKLIQYTDPYLNIL